ncbi:MAG TPA: HEAT repeat domain-containing protein, partial [Candidatus Ozemobacteraceae bacterium]|nr:HEAT repeat domain-containing protein [Candidatus Ozemobacteraceae bacterium]
FAKVIKDKLYGRFDEAFSAFPECVDLNPDYLNGNDEGVIIAGLNFYQDKLERGDQSALFMHSVYLYFKGDFFGSEQGLYKFIETKPSKEELERAQKYLKLIADRREAQAKALVHEPPKKTPNKTPIKTIDKAPKKDPATSTAAVTTGVSGETGSTALAPSDTSNLPPLDDGNVVVHAPHLEHATTKMLKDFDGDQASVVEALSLAANYRIPDPEIVSKIADIVETTDNDMIRAHALDALSRIGAPAQSSLPQITRHLDSDNFFVRSLALNAAANSGGKPEELIPLFVPSFNSKSPAVRYTAIQATVKMGSRAVPALEEALKDATGQAEKSIKQALKLMK